MGTGIYTILMHTFITPMCCQFGYIHTIKVTHNYTTSSSSMFVNLLLLTLLSEIHPTFFNQKESAHTPSTWYIRSNIYYIHSFQTNTFGPYRECLASKTMCLPQFTKYCKLDTILRINFHHPSVFTVRLP